jgi:uncharacterized phage protein (TIGR02220 family)
MRSRSIKCTFFNDEKIGELSHTSRLLFIGLWCYADREGRFEYRPKQIKACVFPYDSINISKFMNEIIEKGMIKIYEIDEKKYGYIPRFFLYQHIHPNEKRSLIPPYNEQNQCHVITGNYIKCQNTSSNVSECKPDILKSDILKSDILIDNILCNDITGNAITSNDITKNVIPYNEIINYLNNILKSNYKPKNKQTRSLIKARWEEGFTLDDFKGVIDKKYNEWSKDENMCAYLRPITLFGKKFESYLNQNGVAKKLNNNIGKPKEKKSSQNTKTVLSKEEYEKAEKSFFEKYPVYKDFKNDANVKDMIRKHAANS